MDNLVTVLQIVATALIVVMSTFFPNFFKKFNNAIDVADEHAGKIDRLAGKIDTAINQATDPVQVFKAKIADGNLSADDIAAIVKEVNEAKGAIKDIKYELVSDKQK